MLNQHRGDRDAVEDLLDLRFEDLVAPRITGLALAATAAVAGYSGPRLARSIA